MAYDLVITNGLIVDGSGMPGFAGDLGIRGDLITAVGKVSGAARRTIDASGLVVAPGFIDHHTHMDGQVCWDPLATSSCYHGVTSIIMGNCGLTLAPCRPQDHDAAIQTFIRVEGIPRSALEAGLPWGWEGFADYLELIGRQLGVNAGCLVGHNAVRQYAMGAAACERSATPEEVRAMREEVRAALRAGALGLSINRNPRHLREDGTPLPSHFADAAEITALGDEVALYQTGIIQTLGGPAGPTQPADVHWYGDLALATRRPVTWQSLRYRPEQPDYWVETLDATTAEVRRGARLFALCNTPALPPERTTERDERRFEAEERMLQSPVVLFGTSDAGAHAASGTGRNFGYTTRLLGDWVRERQALSLEAAIHGLTYRVASLYDIPQRGLLRRGYKADVVLFDPDTVAALPCVWSHDLPDGGKRWTQPAKGIEMTIVNGQPLIEQHQHTGAYPGQVLRNARAAAPRQRTRVAA
jgi:N-acyl-D-aspartate/D-glutamate deacylase